MRDSWCGDKPFPPIPRGKKVAAVVGVSFVILCFIIGMICGFLSTTPSIYIQDLYVPALDTSGTTPSNTSIFVDLKFQRSMALFNLDFKYSNLTLFYSHGTTPVAGYRVRAFSMGGERRVHMMAAMEAPELPWEEAFRAVSRGSTVELVVELAPIDRTCRKSTWDDDDVLRAYVAVDASGHMVQKRYKIKHASLGTKTPSPKQKVVRLKPRRDSRPKISAELENEAVRESERLSQMAEEAEWVMYLEQMFKQRKDKGGKTKSKSSLPKAIIPVLVALFDWIILLYHLFG